MDELLVKNCLLKSWSLKTGSRWTPENPSRGQCSVTALVIQSFYGGEILKTETSAGVWHFYNRIDGRRYDFTADQFSGPIGYDDVESSRDEAFSDTSQAQYDQLVFAFGEPTLAEL